jgi:hypothetical protein
MTSNPRRAKGGSWAVLTLVLLVALPVLYVLSMGPAARLVSNGQLSYETWERVYARLGRLSERVPPAARLLQSYCDWWAFGDQPFYEDAEAFESWW